MPHVPDGAGRITTQRASRSKLMSVSLRAKWRPGRHHQAAEAVVFAAWPTPPFVVDPVPGHSEVGVCPTKWRI